MKNESFGVKNFWGMIAMVFAPLLILYSLVGAIIRERAASDSLSLPEALALMLGHSSFVILPFSYKLGWNLILILTAVILITKANNRRHTSRLRVIVVTVLAIIFGFKLALLTGAIFGAVVSLLLGLSYTVMAGAIIGALEKGKFQKNNSFQALVHHAALYLGLSAGSIVSLLLVIDPVDAAIIAVINIVLIVSAGWLAASFTPSFQEQPW